MKKYVFKLCFSSVLLLMVLLVNSCTKDIEVRSRIKTIESFSFLVKDNEGLAQEVGSIINEELKTIVLEVPYGTDRTRLLPSVKVSTAAGYSPKGAQDFTKEVDYTVTAEDGSKAVYTVEVKVGPNTEIDIKALRFLAEDNDVLETDVQADIDHVNKEIVAIVPLGTNVTALIPFIEVSVGATYAIFAADGTQYDDGMPVNFSEVVKLVVTAEDKSTSQEYSLYIDFRARSDKDVLLAIYRANPGVFLKWDIESDDIETWKGVTVNPSSGKVTRLDMVNENLNGFVILPPEIGYLTALTHLRARVWEFPNELGRLGRLRTLTTLDLSGGKLQELPSEIGNLTGLTFLNLENNDLQELPNEIGNLTNLSSLNIEGNHLERLPEGIGNLRNLTTLNLVGNDLQQLPQEIGNLKDLYFLGLSENNLRELPKEIGNLTGLASLGLRGNALQKLPIEIENLDGVTLLDLSENNLSEFPLGITGLTNLEMLRLNDNQLKRIPDEISKLRKLYYLDLTFNDISYISDDISDLRNNLKELRLQGNLLEEFPEGLLYLTNVHALNLRGNLIDEIPKAIGGLTNLKLLDLSSNSLNEIPSEIGYLKSLAELDVSDNVFDDFPYEEGMFRGHPILKLNLNSALQCIPQGLWEFYYKDDNSSVVAKKLVVDLGRGPCGTKKK